MTSSCSNIHSFDFKQEEIDLNLEKKGLLSLELELSRECNLRCLYCYSNAHEKLNNELTVEEIKDILRQAKDLGAKKIVLLGGGEPLIYENIREVISYIFQIGLEQTIFTNGMLLTDDFADFLFQHQVSVIVKNNSQRENVQDELAGVSGAYQKMKLGFSSLLKAGYPQKKCRMGIQTVICKQNIEEITDMWIWARQENIIPYFETLTYQGRAKDHPELMVSPEELKAVFEKLRAIDQTMFGRQWDVHPTIASFACQRHLYSCLVNSQGYVQPCTGIDELTGNVRKQSLQEIIKLSPTINKLRNIYDHIEGSCADCRFSSQCYGCRGNAYQVTGNYLAEDPSCWLVQK